MAKLRLGVLGLGEGRSIISAALKSDAWELVNVCDLNEALCQERAKEFGLVRYTTSFDEMLADPTIDVIGIYTPDPLHARHIRQCLAAGKNVICTKPLMDSLTEARSLLEMAQSSGRRVFVGQSSRFFEPMMRQRADYEAGKYGNLFSVEAHYHADNRWFSQKSWAQGTAGVKWLYNGISHPIDLVRWYLPDITEVMGYGLLTENGKEAGLAHPDAMHFVLTTADGRIGRVSGCYSSPAGNGQRDSHMTCLLRGSKGAGHADLPDLRYSTHISGEGYVQYMMPHKEPYYFRFGGRSHHAGEYQNYIEYFARCVAAGIPAKPDITEGIITVATMVAMEQSLQERRPVSVPAVLNDFGMGALLQIS